MLASLSKINKEFPTTNFQVESSGGTTQSISGAAIYSRPAGRLLLKIQAFFPGE